MFGAMLPLIYYHVVFLWLKRRDTPADGAAVDSVYYYGFLVTVAALAVSALDVAFDRAQNDDVLFNFGLGLGATGYAVLARMHLMSRTLVDSDSAASEVMNSYIAKTGNLVSDVETAAGRFKTFSENLLNDSTTAHSAAVTRMQEAIVGSTQTFEREIARSFAAAQAATRELREAVTDPVFATERAAFAKSLSQGTRAAKTLDTALSSIATNAQASGEAYVKSKTALDAVTGALTSLSVSLQGLVGSEGSLPNTWKNLEEAAAATSRAVTRTATSLASLNALAEQLNSTGGTIGQMRAFADATTKHLADVVAASQQLDKAVSRFNEAGEAIGKLAEALSQTEGALPVLSGEAKELVGSLASLRVSLTNAANCLESDVTRSAKASSMLTDSLVKVAETIVERTQQRQSLS